MKKGKYFLVAGISLLILALIYVLKGIFPFGDNSVIWGDMYGQITPFFHHLYDSIHGNNSLLVSFNLIGGMNFIGIILYYLASPVNLIILFFSRNDIYLAMSVIVALKIILSAITMMCLLENINKKSHTWFNILLSLIYAFSSYTLMLYQITSWMDFIYLFPLLILGLKKLFETGSSKLYVITLLIALISCCYITLITLVFIFIISLIYLYIYKQPEERKKIITRFSLVTVLTVLIGGAVIFPFITQILASSRIGFEFNVLANSGFGPIFDKASFFLSLGIVASTLVLSVKKFKENKKDLLFIIIVLALLMLPVLIEPINKMLHLGSYQFFPLRYGFIPIAFIILLSQQYFSSLSLGNNKKIVNIITIIIAFASSGIIAFIGYRYFNVLQDNIELLTLSYNKMSFIYLLTIFVIKFIASLLIYLINKKVSKTTFISLTIMTVVNILVFSSFYLGINKLFDAYNAEYTSLLKINEDKTIDNLYRIKNYNLDITPNFGLITNHGTIDQFTSLTPKNVFDTNYLLGYNSVTVLSTSSGGTIFSDLLLGNKYLISDNQFRNDEYTFINNYGDYKLFEYKQDIPFGYLLTSETKLENHSFFQNQNRIYSDITNENKMFINDIPLREKTNLEIEGKKYSIVDKNEMATLNYTANIKDKSNLYLEVSAVKDINNLIIRAFDIYINDNLLHSAVPTSNTNGIIDLGVYENEAVEVKVVFNHSIDLDFINLGVLEYQDLDNFFANNYNDIEVKFDSNKVTVNYNSKKEGILLVPLAYNEDYKVTNNQNDTELVELYGGYMGVKVNYGNNNIELIFMPKSLKTGLLITGIGIIIALLLVVTKIFKKLINSKIFSSTIYIVYCIVFVVLILVIYLIPILLFVKSFIM